MSREVIADDRLAIPALPLPRTAPADAEPRPPHLIDLPAAGRPSDEIDLSSRERGGDVDEVDEVDDLTGGPEAPGGVDRADSGAGRRLAGLRAAWGRPRLSPLAGVALALTALGLGVVAGNGQAQRTADLRAAAATRVVLWADGSATQSGTDPGVTPLSPVRVTLTAAGAPVRLERILLGLGEATPRLPVTLRPGERAGVDLILHPDCGALSGIPTRGAGERDLNLARAVVRTPHGAGPRQVPLDVLGDTSPLMLSLLAPCSAAATGALDEDGEQPARQRPVTISDLRAHSDGRLTFTVHSATDQPATFDLLVAAPTGSPARLALRARPALPLRLKAGSSAPVTVRIVTSCPDRDGTLPPSYGLLQPRLRPDGLPAPDAPVEGWDDGVVAAAVAAAAVHGCG